MGSFYITAITMSKVFVNYVQLLLLPVNLSTAHYVGIPDSVLEPGVLVALILMLLYFAASFLAFRRYGAVFFCMIWLFVALLPVSNLLVPTRILMAERHLYLPSVGFCMLGGIAFHRASCLNAPGKSKEIGAAVQVLFILIVVLYSGLTITRNTAWKDDLTLWSKTVETSPNSPAGHLNLGLAYARLGRSSEAIDEYRKTLEVAPDNYMAYNNLGVEYIKMWRPEDAIEEFENALAIKPDFYEARANLGSVFLYGEDFQRSIEEFKKAEVLKPNDPKLHSALAVAYFYTGQYDLAIEEAEKAVELEPTNMKYRGDLEFIKGNVSGGLER